MSAMEHFSFDNPADVFVGGGRQRSRLPIVYKRFATGAEAVRFAVELQGADKLTFTVIEADEGRFDAADIRSLYESPGYPLPRRQAS